MSLTQAAGRGLRHARILFLASLSLFGVAACASPDTKFYTLSEAPPTKALPSSTGAILGVGKITLPETLDRPQIVRRGSESLLNVDDFSRWGGPLTDGISRVLAADLRLRLGPDRVVLLSTDPVVKPVYTLEAQFERFDVDMAGRLILQAHWSLNVGMDSRTLAVERTSRIVQDGTPGIDGSVATMSRGLGQLADEISAAAAVLPARPAGKAPTALTPTSSAL